MGQLILGLLYLLTVLPLPLTAQAADPYEPLSVLRIENRPAPDFSLPSVDSRTVRLSDYKGKVVLLGFFQTF